MSVPHCTSVQLSAHLDGELSPTARVALQAHLSSCTACAARLAGLRAIGVALRRRFEAEAEARDMSGFTASVLGRLKPYRPSLGERLGVAWEEWRTHRPGTLFGGLGLSAAAVAAVLLLPQPPRPAAVADASAQNPSVEAISTDEQSHIAPVVLKTEGGDAIIWLVDHPDRPSLSLGTDASVPDVTPPPSVRPKGGEL